MAGNTVSVKITGDPSGGIAAINQFTDKLDEAAAKSPTVKLGIDDDSANARLDDVRAKLDALSERVATASADVDDDAALAKLSALQVLLNRVDKRTVKANVSIGGIAQSEVDLAAVNAQLDTFGKNLDTTSTKAKAASKSVGGGGDGGGGGGLIAGAMAMGPAFAAAGVVAVGALTGVAGAAATAGIGLGAFALAAAGDLAGVETQAKSLLAAFQQANQAAVMPALQGAIDVLPFIFDDLTPLVQGTSTALQGFEAQAESALTGSFWTQFSDYLGNQAGPALTSFGAVIGGSIRALAGLDQAFAPLISDAESGLDKLGAKLSAFGQNAGTNGGLAAFVNMVQRDAPQVESTLSAIGSAVEKVGSALGGFAGADLTAIRVVASAIGGLASADPILIELAAGLLLVSKAASTFSGVSAAFNAFNSLGGKFDAATGKITGFVNTLRGVQEAAPAVEAADEGIGVSLGSMLGPIGLAAVGVTALIGLFDHQSSSSKKASTAAQEYATDLENSFDTAGDSTAQKIKLTQSSIDGLGATLRANQATVDGWKASVIAANANSGNFGDTGKALVNSLSGAPAAVKAANTAIGTESARIAKLTGDLGQLKTQQKAAGDATALAGTQATVASDDTGKLNGYFANLASAASNASSALSNMNNAYNSLFGATTNASLAVDQDKQSVDGLVSSIQGSTDKALSMDQAFGQFSQHLLSTTIPAQLQAGQASDKVTSSANSTIAAFEAEAAKAGLTASQIQILASKYGLIPTDVSTLVTVDDQATGPLATINAKLNALQGKVVTSTVRVQQVALGASAGVLGNAGFALGTSYAPGGVALVGENGPELVNLPAGSQVIPNGPTTAILDRSAQPLSALGSSGSGGGNVTINQTFVTPASAQQIARETTWAVGRAAAAR